MYIKIQGSHYFDSSKLVDVDENTKEDRMQKSESLLFESLYILNRVQPLTTCDIPIISNLGAQCFILYGDVLMVHEKYKYACLSYENSCSILNHLSEQVEYHGLIRRLCDICMQQEVK